ncbi:LysR family transcriptional regulator [Paenibacillus macerans]|uniref:LysR substrate-binding domain-containing protein n=1 Tax=Paenibacillus macerans TaxID=44252 RepID=UPI0020403049|nr:LysR family transcriptional regulator [Paenibacillus macerans]MCM3703378.1 LysR family transcriptional regulator [Paenibacillus macerans]
MNLQQLKAFVLAVELQKLYLVAQKLDITQPTVTFHLNKLQEELGVSLFHTKSYHVIRLTEAGKAFYHYASQISALSSEAESTMDAYRGFHAGKLSIGSTHTPATYLLPPLLEGLKRSYPGLSILLDVRPAPFIMEKIKQYELDLGIISQTFIDDPELVALPLTRDDLVLIFDPEHPLAGVAELSPGLLAGYPFVSHEQGSISRRLIDGWAETNGVALEVAMEVSGSEALKAAVMHRIGFGMIAEACVQMELAEGKLLSRKIPGWEAERFIYTVRHRNKLVSPAMRMFWNAMEERWGTSSFALPRANTSD